MAERSLGTWVALLLALGAACGDGGTAPVAAPPDATPRHTVVDSFDDCHLGLSFAECGVAAGEPVFACETVDDRLPLVHHAARSHGGSRSRSTVPRRRHLLRRQLALRTSDDRFAYEAYLCLCARRAALEPHRGP